MGVVRDVLRFLEQRKAAQFKRDIIKSTMKQRSYAATTPGSMNSTWLPRQRTSADKEIRQAVDGLNAKAGRLYANVGLIKGAVDTKTNMIVGDEIMPKSLAVDVNGKPDIEFRKKIQDLWLDAVETIDMTGRSFLEDVSLVTRTTILDGNTFCIKHKVDDRHPLKIEIVGYDRLRTDQEMVAVGDELIIQGIKYNKQNQPTGYVFWQEHPDDRSFGGTPLGAINIDAKSVWHLFEKEKPDQRRGVTQLHAVLLNAYGLGEYQDYELDGARAAASVAWAVTTNEPETPVTGIETSLTGDGSADSSELPPMMNIKPGAEIRLAPGEDIRIMEHNKPGNNYEQFVNVLIRDISAGLGMSFESVSNNYSGSSYSSARNASIQERRNYSCFRALLRKQWLNGLWREFVKTEIAVQNIFPKDKNVRPERLARVDWSFSRWNWIDPVSEVQSQVLMKNNGLTTLEDIAAEQGKDWRNIKQQQKKEQELNTELGLKDISNDNN